MPEQNSSQQPTTLLTWETKEYEEKTRHPDWHWYAGLVAVLSSIIAFAVRDIFFGIFLLIAGVMVIFYARRAPEHWRIAINTDGVRINNDLFLYKNIRQWWLDETGKQDKLLLAVRANFTPMLTITLDGVTKDAVREALKDRAPEIEMHQPVSVTIFDRLGF